MSETFGSEVLRMAGVVVFGRCKCAIYSEKHIGTICQSCLSEIVESSDVVQINEPDAKYINRLAQSIHRTFVADGTWDGPRGSPIMDAHSVAAEIIRFLDYAVAHGYDIGKAIMELHRENLTRE
jgi:hypothetical protein